MKVLIISNHYRTFVVDQTTALSKNKVSIEVLVHHNYLSELARYIPLPYFRHVEKYSIKNLVEWNRIPPNINVRVVSTLYFLPDGKNWGLGDKLYKKYREYLLDSGIKFDLIHAHFTWPSGYVAVKLGKEFRVPVVVTAHGYDVYDLPFRGRAWFEKVKYTLDTTNHIITVSNSNKEILLEKLNIPKDKISVIPNGFDPKLFHPMDQTLARKKLGLPLDKKIILNVASLVPIKGHEYLIQAMKKVVRQRKDVLLVIVGEGQLRGKLQQVVTQLELDKYVKFVGARPHHEIPLWMNAADIFVLPSLSEGNPTVMFEALGVGLPFVGTAVGGVPEIITSEDYGLLCEPANPKNLAEKILIALEKEWDREKIRKYAGQFTWKKIANKILEIYKEVAGSER